MVLRDVLTEVSPRARLRHCRPFNMKQLEQLLLTPLPTNLYDPSSFSALIHILRVKPLALARPIIPAQGARETGPSIIRTSTLPSQSGCHSRFFF
jgi:hypothetical protein